MCRFLLGLIVFVLVPLAVASAQTPKKKLGPYQKKQLAQFAKLVKQTPSQFIQTYDKNNNESIDKSEAPRFLQRGFAKLDQDSNDLLDASEVENYLRFARRYVTRLQQGKSAKRPTPKQPAPKVANKGNPRTQALIKRLMSMDKNGDGKIVRKEASKLLARAFDKFDYNNDGALSQKEVQRLAQLIVSRQGKQGRPGAGRFQYQRGFDSFDADANGRVTRQELQNTNYARRFAQMDKDNNGYLTRREFENLSKQK